MTSYLDPMSALSLARTSRQEEIRAAELYHLVHSLDEAAPVRSRRWRWPTAWHRPAVTH